MDLLTITVSACNPYTKILIHSIYMQSSVSQSRYGLGFFFRLKAMFHSVSLFRNSSFLYLPRSLSTLPVAMCSTRVSLIQREWQTLREQAKTHCQLKDSPQSLGQCRWIFRKDGSETNNYQKWELLVGWNIKDVSWTGYALVVAGGKKKKETKKRAAEMEVTTACTNTKSLAGSGLSRNFSSVG